MDTSDEGYIGYPANIAAIPPVHVKCATVLECQEQDCPFNRECANHCTAGDFRTEDGLVPDIRKINDKYCCDRNPQPSFLGAVLSDFTHCND